MEKHVKVGISRDLFDDEEQLIIPGAGLKLLDEMKGVEYEMFSEFQPEMAPEQVRGCDMVISAVPAWTEESLAQSDSLIAVLYTGVGYDHFDVGALTRAGVLFCFAPDAVRRPVAVTIITHMLALATKLINKDRLTREGRWEERTNYNGEGLTGKTLGVIGAGNIGHELLKLARVFEMRHLVCDPYLTQQDVADVEAELVDIDALLSQSDYVSLSVPLNEKTRHLIGAQELGKMKPTAYLINTSRGSVVDEPALISALHNKTIRGAGLDVFEREPVAPDNPLLEMDNVVVSPHSLCHTDEYYMGTWDQKLRQLCQIREGQIPEALVNPDVVENPVFKQKFARFET